MDLQNNVETHTRDNEIIAGAAPSSGRAIGETVDRAFDRTRGRP
jgi:hypothetical protein